MNATSLTPISPRLVGLVADLLKSIHCSGDFKASPILGGRNNLVFRVETEQGLYLFKEYFNSPQDTRNRLRHEYQLLEFLKATASPYAATPYAANWGQHVALMEFIQGSRIELIDVGEYHIQQAVGFYTDLNRDRLSELGLQLPIASEACFSLSEHISITQRRVDRLEQIQSETSIDHEAIRFTKLQILPLWQKICSRIELAIQTGEHTAEVLPLGERCLSPSDFGFHNALQQADGLIRFVDFEYAGWDDPAKMIADFANQPDMTLERFLSSQFMEAVIAQHSAPEKLRLRVQLVEPLYQIKWACICLNDFLAVGKSRRSFTGETHEISRKEFQLQQACKMLRRAEETFHNSH